MENRYMKEFIVLAETCNFWETAEKLYITQSSLSKHISKMEDELGVPLFDRTTRSVALNEYGTVFYEYAKQIVKLSDEYNNAINRIRLNDDNKLSIGFLARLGQYGIVELLSDFSKNHPYISLNMLESNQPKELLRSKACNLVFAAEYDQYSQNDSDIKCLLYKVDNLVAVFPSNHPLAKEEHVTVEQLRDQNYVMHGDSAGNTSVESRNFRKLCMAAGFEPNVIMTASFTSTIIKLVSQGTGISVMNRMYKPSDANSSVSFVDIYPIVPFYIYVFYLKNCKMSPAAADFLRYIEAWESK